MAKEPPDHSIPPVTQKYPRSIPQELPTLPEFTGSLTFTVGNKRARKTTTLQLGRVSRSTSPDPDPRFFPLPTYNSPSCKETPFLVFTQTSQENGRLEVQSKSMSSTSTSSFPTHYSSQENGMRDDVHQESVPSTSVSSNPPNYRRCPKELPMLPEYTGSLTFCLGSGRRSGGLRTPSSNMFTLEVPSTPLNSLHEDDTKLPSSHEDTKHNVGLESVPSMPTSSNPTPSSHEAIRHDGLSLQSVPSTSKSAIPTPSSHEAIRLDVLPLQFIPSTLTSPIPMHSSLHEDGKHGIPPESMPSMSTQNTHLHTANDEDMPKVKKELFFLISSLFSHDSLISASRCLAPDVCCCFVEGIATMGGEAYTAEVEKNIC